MPIVRLVEQHVAMSVEGACGFAADMHDGAEGLGEPRRDKRGLSGVVMDVEHAALAPGGRGCLGLVNGGGHAVHAKDLGQQQATEARTDDGDGRSHGNGFNGTTFH